jgi:hypothetical protein
VFLYTGWLLVEGQLVYVHFWDIKPPVIHYTTAILYLLTGGNPLMTHILATSVGAAAMVGSAIMVSALVEVHTNNKKAAFAAASSLLAFPTYYSLAAGGLRPKYLFCFFGLIAMYLYINERFVSAGAFAALSAATYQLGLIFVVIVLIGAYRDQTDFISTTVSIGIVGFVVIAPFLLTGELWAMTRQVVLIPILDRSDAQVTALTRIQDIIHYLPLGGALTLFGIGGVVVEYISTKNFRWLLAVIILFLLTALFVDLNGPPDLLQLVTFGAIGLGLMAERLSVVDLNYAHGVIRGDQAAILLVVIAVVMTIPSLMGVVLEPNATTTQVAELYFDQKHVDRCHIRMSTTEKWWVKASGVQPTRERCVYTVQQMMQYIRYR